MLGERRAEAVNAIVVALLVLLHFTFRPFLLAAPVAPDLLVGGLLLAALRLRAGYAALLGFILGLLEAAMALEGMGEVALVLAVVGYMGARSRDLLFADARYFVPAYVFAGTWLAQAGILLLVADTFEPVRMFVIGPGNAVLTALLCGIAERVVAATWR
jgi:cell shape-determining protein MreD